MSYAYETHSLKNPLLPFVYFPEMLVAHRQSRPNWHEDMELLWCLEGAGTVRYGSQTMEFRPGDVLGINTDIVHYIASQGQVRYRCLIIKNAFLADNGIAPPSFLPKIQDPELFSQCEAVAEAFSLGEIPEIRYRILGLLRILGRKYRVPREETQGPNEYVKQTLIYIRQHLNRTMTLDEIAAHVGITKYHLTRQFRTYTGKTIVETINLLRCNEARLAMEEGMGVSQAARSCGFENLSYFTRTFRRLMGVLPSACLKKNSPPR